MAYPPQSVSDTPREAFDPDAPLCTRRVLSNGAVYQGSGIKPGFHPAAEGHFRELLCNLCCGRCGSLRILITYLRLVFHTYSGDGYWDIEARCHDCRAFNWYTGHD